jgi:hypothetical protein
LNVVLCRCACLKADAVANHEGNCLSFGLAAAFGSAAATLVTVLQNDVLEQAPPSIDLDAPHLTDLSHHGSNR